MKDILITRLDAIDSSLANMNNFEHLDQQRFSDLDGLIKLLGEIRDQIHNNHNVIANAHLDLQKLKENLERETTMPNLFPSPVDVQDQLKEAMDVKPDPENEINKAVKKLNAIRSPRRSVIDYDLSKIAVASFKKNIEKIQERIIEVKRDIQTANTYSEDEAEELRQRI